MAAYSYVIGGDHDFSDPSKSVLEQSRTSAGVSIGDGAWIGAGAKILDGVTIGDGASSAPAPSCATTVAAPPSPSASRPASSSCAEQNAVKQSLQSVMAYRSELEARLAKKTTEGDRRLRR